MRGLVVDARTLEVQLREIRRSYVPLSLEEYEATLGGARGLPSNGILLTFDDGFSDFREYVAPLLVKMGIPATLFARTPGHGGRPSAASLDVLYAAVATRPPGEVTPESLMRIGRQVLEAAPERQLDVIREWTRTANIDDLIQAASALYLRDSDLREIATEELITLASHGTAHVRADVLRVEQALEDYQQAMEALTPLDATGARAIAFPDGDTTHAGAAASVGYSLGFGLEVGKADISRHRLRRILADNSPGWPLGIATTWGAP